MSRHALALEDLLSAVASDLGMDLPTEVAEALERIAAHLEHSSRPGPLPRS